MPPHNMNCVVPRQQHSPSSPGILGPPRDVLPTVLLRTIQACVSSEAISWGFAENVGDFTAELQWPTNVPTNKNPFLAFPPALLTIVDQLDLPKPTWSINVANNVLSCRLIWSSLPAMSTPAAAPARKPVPATPLQTSPPQNDSGYLSTPPSSPPSLPRSRLTFIEAVSSSRPAVGSSPQFSPVSPKQSPSTISSASQTRPTSTKSTPSQTNAVTKIKQQQPLSKKSMSSQTAFPLSFSTNTQTTVIEPAAACISTQTPTTQLQSSSCQSTPPPSTSIETQTAVLPTSTTTATTTSTSTEVVEPSCRLCESPNLDTNFTYHHLFSCTSHPTNAELEKDFTREWAKSQINPDIFPDVLALLAAVGTEDPTQSHSDTYTDLLSTATNILYANTNECASADEILDDLQTMMSTIAADALTHLGLPNTTNLTAIYEFDTEIINNPFDSDDDASVAVSTASDHYNMPVPDDVAYFDDDWTNLSDYDAGFADFNEEEEY